MAFVVDGSEWHFDGWDHEEIKRVIDNFLERVLIARDRGEVVWIGDDFQTRSVLEDRDLWSMFSPSSPVQLSMEICQELSAWLGTAPLYLDDPSWPDGAEEALIQVEGEAPVESQDIAWAHHRARNGSAMACLGLKRSGPHLTTSKLGEVTLYWVQDEKTHRDFWRSAIKLEGDDESALERLSPHAYPDLYFHPDVWRGLSRLVGGYFSLRSEVQRYLATLDEFGHWVFTFPPPALRPGESAGPNPTSRPSHQIVERRFQGLKLDMAPENPSVFKDRKCREAREIKIGSKILFCEWHGKIEPHQNRMHIHPPISESGGKVVIAIIHRHLPLPGD